MEQESQRQAFAVGEAATAGAIIDSADKLVGIIGKLKKMFLGDLETAINKINLDVDGITLEKKETMRHALKKLFDAKDNVENTATQLEILARDTIDRTDDMKYYLDKVKEDWDHVKIAKFIHFEAKKMAEFIERSTDLIAEATKLYTDTQKNMNSIKTDLIVFQDFVTDLANQNTKAYKDQVETYRLAVYIPCCVPCPLCCIACAATLETIIADWGSALGKLTSILDSNNKLTEDILMDIGGLLDFVKKDLKLVLVWGNQLAKISNEDFTIPEAELFGFTDAVKPTLKSLESLKGAAVNYLKSHDLPISE